MHISLTPELENIVRSKVSTGLYNNASEVIREALRFMATHEELVNEMKLEKLRAKLVVGAEQARRGEFVGQTVSEIVKEAKQERDAK